MNTRGARSWLTIKRKLVSKAAPLKITLAILPMIHNGRLKQARKAVKCPEGDLRISKLGMAAAVTVRKMILSVPVVHPNGVAKEAIPPVLKLTGRKVWTMSRKLFRTKTAEWRKTTAEQIARERDNPGFPNIFEATIRGMTE